MHRIEVNDIKLYAYHGCLNEEAVIGGNYSVSIVLHMDFTEAAEEDDLSKTIDYVKVNQIVREEMQIRSKLIEHVALRIVKKLQASFVMLEKLQIKVTKINPPINGDVKDVSVIIES